MKLPFKMLYEVADVIMGQSPSSQTYNILGQGLPFFQGKTEFGEVYPTAVKWCSEPQKIAFPGDILISVRAPVGPTNLAKEKCCIGRGLAAIRVRPEVVDRDFLWYFLRASEGKLVDKGQGSTFESINSDDINSLKIPRIALEKQLRIAAQLKAQLAEAEKARKAAEAQLKDAEAISAAYSHEIFSREKMECWTLVLLGDASEIVSGITLGRKAKDESLREVPYLRVANVKDGRLDLAEVKTIEATETEIEKWRLRVGDILLTEGGDPDKLGRGTFWSGELAECIHQNHIFRVRFPADRYLPEFVSAQVGSPYGKAYFLAHAKKTTGIATINQKVLKAFPLFSPPLEKQKEVMTCLSEKLKEAQKIIAGLRRRLEEIDILPNRLLSQAFEMN